MQVFVLCWSVLSHGQVCFTCITCCPWAPCTVGRCPPPLKGLPVCWHPPVLLADWLQFCAESAAWSFLIVSMASPWWPEVDDSVVSKLHQRIRKAISGTNVKPSIMEKNKAAWIAWALCTWSMLEVTGHVNVSPVCIEWKSALVQKEKENPTMKVTFTAPLPIGFFFLFSLSLFFFSISLSFAGNLDHHT